jgi:zinc transporter ZupT
MDYLILLSSIVLGAIFVFVFKLHKPAHVKLLNAFTGAYLLSLTLLHLLPELYLAGRIQTAANPTRIGLFMLTGFFIQVALDVITVGVEHGHAHPLHTRMPWGVLAGLCLHAVVEATALGTPQTHFDPSSRRLLLWSIVMHNFPVSIALLGMLLQTGMRSRNAVGLLALFAAMAPLGLFLSAHTELAHHTRELMAVVIGIFMHISTTILFESSDIHRFNMAKLAAIVVGVGLGIASLMVH